MTCKDITRQVRCTHPWVKNEWNYTSTPHLRAEGVDKDKHILYIQKQNLYLLVGPGLQSLLFNRHKL